MCSYSTFPPCSSTPSTVLFQESASQLGLGLSVNLSSLGWCSGAPHWLGCCCQRPPTHPCCALSHKPKLCSLLSPAQLPGALAFAVGTLCCRDGAQSSACLLTSTMPGPCLVSEGKEEARKVLKMIPITNVDDFYGQPLRQVHFIYFLI